ncbi:hypothetical protein QBC47DRAFT_356721 [Echria macrotheca]|uniref:Uncharacterized protein n=1 Tax=Echria macrotheca TaxID=438768 RepID=A0AAJ0F980_9PEZI|nr:hypothetical protein QBC47DRAFT_356721 [Echria macrotheca]
MRRVLDRGKNTIRGAAVEWQNNRFSGCCDSFSELRLADGAVVTVTSSGLCFVFDIPQPIQGYNDAVNQRFTVFGITTEETRRMVQETRNSVQALKNDADRIKTRVKIRFKIGAPGIGGTYCLVFDVIENLPRKQTEMGRGEAKGATNERLKELLMAHDAMDIGPPQQPKDRRQWEIYGRAEAIILLLEAARLTLVPAIRRTAHLSDHCRPGRLRQPRLMFGGGSPRSKITANLIATQPSL